EQRQQRIALRAWREGVERLLGALGELDGSAEGVLDRPVFLEQAQEFVPLLIGRGARADDVADDLLAELFTLLQKVDQRQRHLPFAEVGAHRFAERGQVAGEVQQIINDLKRNAEIEAVLLQRLFLV